MQITTQILRNPNRIVRYICSMMEIGDFFAQVKVRLFFIWYANYDPDFTKSQQRRTVYLRYAGNRGLFRTSQGAAFFIGYANYDPDFTKSQPNRTVYIKQHDGNRELFAQVNVRPFLSDMRITTQISQNPNRVGRCISGMMEIGNFFAQVKVRLFLIGYANYDPDFTKSQPNRTVYMQYDGNRRLFRTSQIATFFMRCELRPRFHKIPTESYGI